MAMSTVLAKAKGLNRFIKVPPGRIVGGQVVRKANSWRRLIISQTPSLCATIFPTNCYSLIRWGGWSATGVQHRRGDNHALHFAPTESGLRSKPNSYLELFVVPPS